MKCENCGASMVPGIATKGWCSAECDLKKVATPRAPEYDGFYWVHPTCVGLVSATPFAFEARRQELGKAFATNGDVKVRIAGTYSVDIYGLIMPEWVLIRPIGTVQVVPWHPGMEVVELDLG